MTSRLMYFYAFLCTVGMLVLGFYVQFGEGINPCPLCILQRIDLALLAILFFFGVTLTLKKFGRFVLAFFTFIVSAMGIFFAGRQVWLQHLPANQSTDCGVSLQYMLQVFPFDEVVKKVFAGTAECSQIDWSFLGLSMAHWTLVGFVIFAIFSLWQAFTKVTHG